MSVNYVFYNPLAGNGTGSEEVKKVEEFYKGDCQLCDMTKPETYSEILPSIKEDDKLVICGGDGTLNRFLNLTDGVPAKCPVFFFPLGTGNDFAFDLGKKDATEPFEITQYIQRLPKVEVKGKSYKFLNGVGYGIDGYCCEVGDELREKSDKPVNYAGIAIKGLLFNYKPTNAKITIDGKVYEYKKVWLAPTMNGRCYGGGMIATPNQDRLKNDTLSVLLFHGSGKIKTLAIFPSIFKGEHVKHTDCVTVLTGKDIKVEFDSPRALQIDGETVKGVTEYSAKAPQ